MSHEPLNSRRAFLGNAAVASATAPFFVRNLISAPPSGTVRLAAFGAGNMAFYTLDGIAMHPSVKLVCVAEVDSVMAANMKTKYTNARVYTDWREMLRKERKNVDAVSVGTPDHMHAPMAMSAMQMGLHAYVQKPLAHDIYEVRRLREMAQKKKLVTQMGIQIHSNREYRAAVQVIRGGAIGKVKEVYSFSDRTWGDPAPMPDRSDPVPPTLNWDQWLGVCANRPFIGNYYYHPANWRKRIDFGTATFGDMGCHIFDPVFESLGLSAPLSVRSEGPTPGRHSWAVDSSIHYVHPATLFTDGPVKLHWYDGAQRPPAEVQALVGSRRLPGQGSIFVGTKGVMLLEHIGMPVLLPEKDFSGFEMPKTESSNHYFQFVDAILGKDKATTSFDYSGPLTETVLLGPVATRFPRATLEWDAVKLRFRNSGEATGQIKRKYRSGWRIKGLS